MEARIVKLEEFAAETHERLANIEARVEQTHEEVNTLRVEMHKGFADIIKWIMGTAVVLSGTFLTVITFVLNNAVLKAPPPASQPPIVIYAQPAPPK